MSVGRPSPVFPASNVDPACLLTAESGHILMRTSWTMMHGSAVDALEAVWEPNSAVIEVAAPWPGSRGVPHYELSIGQFRALMNELANVLDEPERPTRTLSSERFGADVVWQCDGVGSGTYTGETSSFYDDGVFAAFGVELPPEFLPAHPKMSFIRVLELYDIAKRLDHI